MSQRFLLPLLLDILVIAFVLLFPHYSGLPMFVFPFIVLLVIALSLHASGQPFSRTGFSFRTFGWRPFLIGGAIGLIYAVADIFTLPYLFGLLGVPRANLADFDFIRHNLVNFIFLMVIAWLVVIPFEEIAFRGFIFTKIREWVPAGRWQFLISAILTSILFALYHVQLGLAGVLNAFIFALFISWLYKIFKGNLWYLIFFHAVYDTFVLNLIRMGHVI